MKNEIKISNKDKKGIIYGLLLGDASKPCKNIIEFSHTDKQKEYCYWKIEFLKELGFTTYMKTYDNVKTNYGIFNYYRGKVTISFGDDIDKRMYQYTDSKGRPINKKVTKYVMQRIHPIGLLLWFMDDGSFIWHRRLTDKTSITRQATIAINGFDNDSMNNIVKGLKERFDLNLKLHKDHKSFRLYFSATEFRKFIDIVRPYLFIVPKHMLYKFCMRYTKTRRTDSIHLYSNYNLCSGSCLIPDKFCGNI